MESTKTLEICLFAVFVLGGIGLPAYFFWVEWRERKLQSKNRSEYKSELIAKDYYKKDEKTGDYASILRTYLFKHINRKT